MIDPWKAYEREQKEVVAPSQKTTFFRSCISDCPIVQTPEVRISWALWQRMIYLAQLEREEWMCYLMGDIETRTIQDVWFPAQTRTSVECTALPGELEKAPAVVIGRLHSHHTMNAFFSKTDWEHMNGKIEIVVNAKGEYKANCLVKLDCQRFGRAEAKVMLTDCPLDQSNLTPQIVLPRVEVPLLEDGWQLGNDEYLERAPAFEFSPRKRRKQEAKRLKELAIVVP